MALGWILRRCKYYVLINAFICGVAYTSLEIAALGARSSAEWLAIYGATLLRIAAMVLWFEWIATLKDKIYGHKRHVLSATERRGLYYRILLVVVPMECLTYWLAVPNSDQVDTEINGARVYDAQAPARTAWLYEFVWFIPQSLAFELVFDFFHFTAHWICHQSTWLYQHVHKRHHMHLHPCPLSTYEQDGFDLLLTNVLPFVAASKLTFAVSPWQFHLLLAYKSYVEVAGHSGLDIKGYSFPQLPMLSSLSICLRVHDHDVHHTHPKWNFAKRFAVWDKLFGTFRPATTN
ncbi:TPA: hypothetical protein N0F65_010751 [Lagenidium giganteum]|uniref:Fatty acid hydroxylase domain-containing protein n=1 Tax=Lagenidium giganteum TaxID=4803 RepID=A0AAV2YSM6_9STRA|nr:TPA: hypothetical protein N0F65_010751 [Lagenidium giganteum]